MLRLVFPLLAIGIATGQAITSFVGNGVGGYSGDGGPATVAQVNYVTGLATDSNGNIYLADQNNNVIRKVDTHGVITTFAGSETPGFSGDGGAAGAAKFNVPTGVCVAPSGDIYVNDIGNYRVRKISAATGIISTVAGNGSPIPSGDGGPATSAGMHIPDRCAVDPSGNLYIVDQGNNANVVRKVDSTGTITLVAGSYGGAGFSGDGGPATKATMFNLTAITIDSSGNLFLTDQGDQRIRRVDATSGIITTVAGNGTAAFSGDGGQAIAASLNYPGMTAFDAAGNLFIVDSANDVIRKVTPAGVISTVAGMHGVAGYSGDGGSPLQATLNVPFAMTIDKSANVYVADTADSVVRKITGVAAFLGPAITVTGTNIGVTNGASFQTGVSPGGIVTIFGTNLGATAGQTLVAPGAPWPLSLGTTSVTMNGTNAPMYYVLNSNGQEQVSVQVPWSIAGANSATVVVNTSAGTSTPVTVPVLGAQPGIFILNAASSGATHVNGSVVTPSNPATKGETLVMYLTALGPVTNQPASGTAASSTTLSYTTIAPQVVIGGFNAQLAFSGLAPGFIGTYQINVMVPAAAPSGSVQMTVAANGVTSNVATLSIQ